MHQVRTAHSYFIVLLLLGGTLLAANGCTTRNVDGEVRHYSFGFTVVTLPKSAPNQPKFAVREIKTHGITFGLGHAGIGYSCIQAATLPPSGALYFQVRNAEDFERIEALIKQYPTKEICVTQIPAR